MDVGHADAAVHLDHLVGHQMGEIAHLGLGQRGGRAVVARPGVDGCSSAASTQERVSLQVGEHLGRAVLQALERADHLAELGAGLQVVEGDLEGLQGAAEHLGGQAGAGAVEHRLQHGPALADLAERHRPWRRRR